MIEKTARSPGVNDNARAAVVKPRQSALRSFVLARWRGEVPLRVAFWWDMVCVGTAINLAAGLAGMLLLAADMLTVIAVIVFFSPLPYNVLLVLSVWRSAEKSAGPATVATQLAAVIWIILATVM
jgi:hypothetical protein